MNENKTLTFINNSAGKMPIPERPLGVERTPVPTKKEALMSHLSALGNPKLTSQIVKLIAEEIEKDLRRRKIKEAPSQLLGEMLETKLTELGLSDKKSHAINSNFNDSRAIPFTVMGADFLTPEILEAMAPSADNKQTLQATRSETIPEKAFSRFSPKALDVLRKRYLIKNEIGEVIETPEELFGRVARTVAGAETKYSPKANLKVLEAEFYNLMINQEFLPDAPTLLHSGRDFGSLSAFFVLPLSDSLESIFETIKQATMIQQTGGIAGFTFSSIRPKNDRVGLIPGISSGPVSFMKVFDAAAQTIRQENGSHGFYAGMLHVSHPDILEFITSKNNEGDLSAFHIAVGLSDDFMQAVEKDETFSLINPRPKGGADSVRARKLFWAIIHQAWKNGEPRAYFTNRLEAANSTPVEGALEAVGLSGEHLLPHETVPLGSVNLGLMVENETINWSRLRRVVHQGIHFLDNVIEANSYPLLEVEEKTKKGRKIGLGIMGWADMLVALGVPYNSDEALSIADQVMSFVQQEAEKASILLAQKRGAFPNYYESIFSDRGLKRRNATVTAITSTKTISLIADCSAGIAPQDGFNSTPAWQVKMQATFQRHTENGVATIVNLPDSATEEDVAQIYWMAYQLGCKEIAVSRNHSHE